MKKKDFDPNNYNKLNNLRKKIIKDTSSFINMDNKKIIEIGSGNGNFSKLLSKKFNSSYIYGIDIVSQYIDFSKKNNNNYLLYGRRSHPTSSNLDIKDDYNELNSEYKKYFNKDIEYFYHTHDVMTYDNMPFIGKIDNNLYIMTGFNKWGNTNGVIGGKLISDLIEGKHNDYEKIFTPRRSMSKDKIKNLLVFNTSVMSRYIINKINPHMKYYSDDVEIKFIEGKRCGIYTDGNGNKHIVSNICPHMKCNLVFNYIDKTWDCPCHASRFDIDGNIIYGPAVYDIKIK